MGVAGLSNSGVDNKVCVLWERWRAVVTGWEEKKRQAPPEGSIGWTVQDDQEATKTAGPEWRGQGEHWRGRLQN